MVKSKRFKSLNERVLIHPSVNDVLIYDIETDSLDTESAQVKFVGCYSYKYEKYFIIHDYELDKFELLLREHRVIVGFNNKSFDNEVLMNKVNNIDLSYKVIFDCLRVLYDHDRKRPNRELIIKHNGKTLHESLKNRKLRTVADTLGFETLKADIDYKVFQKNHWSQGELSEIYKYLLADVDVTRLLFEFYVEYFDNFREFVDDKNISRFDYIRSSLGSFSYAAFCHLAGLPFVFEDDPSLLKRKPLNTGGFVLEPKEEFHDGVVVVKDFSSLYPTIYFQCNLFTHDDSSSGWCGDGFFNIQGSYNQERLGKVEGILKKVFYKRAEYKEKGDPRELPLKIMMNALYGLNGNAVFKSLFDMLSPGDCTSIGQTCIKYAKKVYESFGVMVIYADTDSVFLRLPKGMSVDELDRITGSIICDLQSHMPFPDPAFGLKTDYVFQKLWLHSKKFYVGITDNGKLVVKGHSVIKGDASLLGQKIFNKLRKEMLLRNDIKFDKEYIRDLIMVEVHNDPSIIGQYYSARSKSSYKSRVCIQYQISEVLGEGTHLLIPNSRIGRIGKGKKKYATMSEASDLLVSDLVVDKVWNELAPFITDYVSDVDEEKIRTKYEKEKRKEILDYVQSDLFDSEAVGWDISNEEFVENEKYFDINE
jgi:DNA polymerase, archaea type